MSQCSDTFRVRMRGELACFTRPEMKVERVSYEVITPSAARGVIESILWKPQIMWRIHAIEVLAPITWTSFRRNEVTSRASTRINEIIVDDNRTQRNTVALKDVDYVVEASFTLTPLADKTDSVVKYVEMFLRRLHKGQHYHAPYLGCREFQAIVEGAPPYVKPLDVDRSLGWMFYDFNWPNMSNGATKDSAVIRPLLFEAHLKNGVLRVPTREFTYEGLGVQR